MNPSINDQLISYGDIKDIPKDKDWIFQFITIPSYRVPPKVTPNIKLLTI